MDRLLSFYQLFLLHPIYYVGIGTIGIILLIWFNGPLRPKLDASTDEVIFAWMRRLLLLLTIAWFIFVPLVLWTLSETMFDGQHTTQWLSLAQTNMVISLKLFALSMILAVLIKWFIRRNLFPWLSSFIRRYRVSQSSAQRSDIRDDVARIKPKTFEPEKYFRDGYYFLGLDENNKPVYISDTEWKANNLQIIGPTQVGKGVELGVLLEQAISKRITTVFIDPKPDKHGLAIMRRAASQAGVPMMEMDFRTAGEYRYEPFLFGDTLDRKQRLMQLFSLYDTGTNADFYKRKERRAINELFPGWDGTLRQLQQSADANEVLDSVGNSVHELLDLPGVRGGAGSQPLDIPKLIKEGGVLYIRASTKNKTIVKAATAMLQELIQARMSTTNDPHTFIAVDEVRFFVSDTLADTLATISGFNGNMALAHQTIRDLRNLQDKTLDGQSIEQEVLSNTKIKLAYMAADKDTAEWMAERSGTIQTEVYDREKIERGGYGEDIYKGEAFLVNEEQQLISENIAFSLPAKVGVLYRPNELAVTLYTHWTDIDLDKWGYPITDVTAELGEEAAIEPTEHQQTNKEPKPASNNPEVGRVLDKNALKEKLANKKASSKTVTDIDNLFHDD